MVVEDDGVGLPKWGAIEEGHGLRLTRERLTVLYGQDASLEVVRRPEGGTRATLRVPLPDGPAGPEKEASL
jgi:LytS/YehU family sensor histidine kinase